MSKLINTIGPYLESDALKAYAASFAIGVLGHVGLLRFGEWDTYSVRLGAAPFLLEALVSAVLLHLQPDRSVGSAVQEAAALNASLFAGVIASMLVYRAFFHRLRVFPGPFQARLSKFYMVVEGGKRGRPFDVIGRLHAEHGDFVRVGPAELSVADPTAFRAVHANNTRCNKGVWYTVGEPHVNLHMSRDRKDHARRRRIWDQGFSSKGK